MPRYFFDVHEEKNHIDRDGIELVDVGEAKIVATAAAACLLKDDPKRFWCDRGWRLRVRSEFGLPLFEIAFSMRTETQVFAAARTASADAP